jgi:hypothetical protein
VACSPARRRSGSAGSRGRTPTTRRGWRSTRRGLATRGCSMVSSCTPGMRRGSTVSKCTPAMTRGCSKVFAFAPRRRRSWRASKASTWARRRGWGYSWTGSMRRGPATAQGCSMASACTQQRESKASASATRRGWEQDPPLGFGGAMRHHKQQQGAWALLPLVGSTSIHPIEASASFLMPAAVEEADGNGSGPD